MTDRSNIKVINFARLRQTFSCALPGYELWLAKQPFSDHTKRAYLSRNRKFLDYLAGMEETHSSSDGSRRLPLELDCEVADWQNAVLRFRLFLKDTLVLSPNSINNNLTAVEHALAFMNLEIEKASRESWPQLSIRILTALEQRRFIQAIVQCKSVRDQAIAYLLMDTGIKLGECVALDVDDIEISGRAGRVTIQGGRTIRLNSEARRAILKWLIERSKRFGDFEEESALFLNPSGKRISTVGLDAVVRKLGRLAKVDVSAQVIRDTCLENLVRSGSALTEVAEFCGHRNVGSTHRRYNPLIESSKKSKSQPVASNARLD